MKKIFIIILCIFQLVLICGCQTKYKIVDGDGEDGLHYHNDKMFSGTCNGKQYFAGEEIKSKSYEIEDGNGEDGLHYHKDKLFSGTCEGYVYEYGKKLGSAEGELEANGFHYHDGEKYSGICGCAEYKDGKVVSLLEGATNEQIKNYVHNNYPKIDGSTSLIPLDAAIRSYFFDEDLTTAQTNITHSKTWDAFYNLKDNKIDILLSVKMSKEQIKELKEGYVEKEISKEGFVIVVSKDNPIDSLTVQQFKDIYTGKITNWKQVGGNDAKIVAYQRNEDSGSQNYIKTLLGNSLMKPETEVQNSMGGLIDVIANNNYGKNSIGYSYYSFAANMYEAKGDVKLLKINGIAPTLENFSNNKYPFTTYNYIYLNKEPETNSAVYWLIKWLLSDEGQKYIAKAKYATIKDLGIKYGELEKVELYSGKGTGEKVNNVDDFYYVLSSINYNKYPLSYNLNNTKLEEISYAIAFIKDESLENKINQDIKETIEKLKIKYSKLSDSKRASLNVKFEIKNGYLNLNLKLSENLDSVCKYACETICWDIIKGKKLSLEEMFYEGTDIAQLFYEVMSSIISNEYYIKESKYDFVGLVKGDFTASMTYLNLDSNNYYLFDEICETYTSDKTINNNKRDFTSYIDSENYYVAKRVKNKTNTITEEQNADYGYVSTLKEEAYPTAKKINENLFNIIKTKFKKEILIEYTKKYNLESDGEDYLHLSWYLTDVNGYAIFSGQGSGLISEYPIDSTYVFDISSGDLIDVRNLLKTKWKDKIIKISNGADKVMNLDSVNLDDYCLEFFEYNENLTICFRKKVNLLKENDETYWLEIKLPIETK